jgi:hypothetical protein
MNCQRGDIYIYLNKQKVAEKGCSCQEINLSYIIK